jgi:hypothetical protein
VCADCCILVPARCSISMWGIRNEEGPPLQHAQHGAVHPVVMGLLQEGPNGVRAQQCGRSSRAESLAGPAILRHSGACLFPGEQLATINAKRPGISHPLWWWCLFLCFTFNSARATDQTKDRVSVPQALVDSQPVRVPVIEGKGVRFTHLPAGQGLSQVRVAQIIQDDQGFLWFGTQVGVNRYDGYKFKVFTHDLERPNGLSENFVYSLFK